MPKSEHVRRHLQGFLDKTKSKVTALGESAGQGLKSKTQSFAQVENNESINSFSTIFNQDHDQIQGIKRVFRKSILLLSLSLIAFVAMAYASVSLFTVTPLFTLVSFFAYLILSVIFFIIVADRSYVWLCLLAHIFGVLLVSSFVNQLFSPVTLITAGIIAILYYFAYTELEKAQLGSRLFSIRLISKEAIYLLITLALLVLSLGAFGLIKDKGTVNFVEQDILGNEFVFNEVLMGNGRAVNLNRVLIDASPQFGAGNTEYTFREFLIENYRDGGNVIGQSEQTDIILDCQFERGEEECVDIVAITREERLTAYAQEAYPEVDFGLDTVLDGPRYEQIVREYYVNLIEDFVEPIEDQNTADLARVFGFIPADFSNYLLNKENIIPAIVALVIFVIGSLFRPLLAWLVYTLTEILWGVLKLARFVRIEVETVESEVVSI